MTCKLKLALIIGLTLAVAACANSKTRPEDGGSNPGDGPVKPVGDGAKPNDGGGGGAVPGTWVTVKVSTFSMGAAPGEPCGVPDEERQHQVTLTRNFSIMTTEVTQGQFTQVMGYNGSYFKTCGDNCPVDSVSHHEAAQYCNELSKRKGLTPCYSCTGKRNSADCFVASAFKTIYDCPGYRLPTEAEWEFAYRAGTKTAYYSGSADKDKCSVCTSRDANANKIGWYCANINTSAKSPQPVGGKAGNKLGLYDMAGNLYEWTADGYIEDLGTAAVTDPYHDSNTAKGVIKGGCWEHRAHRMRAASRSTCTPKYGTMLIGFRPVRTLK